MAHKCKGKELLFFKLGRYCILHFTKFQYSVYEETEMERWFSEKVCMQLTATWSENRLKIVVCKNILKILGDILTHSYEWANTAVLEFLLGWMQTREESYCAYHQPAIISSTKPLFPTAAKYLLPNWHKTSRGKPILHTKYKAKSTNECFAVSALGCMYCPNYLASLLNKAKGKKNSILYPFLSLTVMTWTSHFCASIFLFLKWR